MESSTISPQAWQFTRVMERLHVMKTVSYVIPSYGEHQSEMSTPVNLPVAIIDLTATFEDLAKALELTGRSPANVTLIHKMKEAPQRIVHGFHWRARHDRQQQHKENHHIRVDSTDRHPGGTK